MQDNVTVSPLDAWSSAGVLTVMEETREGAGGEMVQQKKDDDRVTQRGMKRRSVQVFKKNERRELRGNRQRERRTHCEYSDLL